ncbi:MAG: protein-ADP-ribose hydrolase [Coriobacteriales bacterium]|jgi:O-acetyl-ADP-ribose deacetylase (regulator of RNase III)
MEPNEHVGGNEPRENTGHLVSDSELDRMRDYMIEYLMSEDPRLSGTKIPEDEFGKRKLLRALMNIRDPKPISDDFLKVQDSYLKTVNFRKGIVSIEDLRPVRKGIYLWRGDITRLATDAIVNAANSALLGCFSPNHSCIDNAIHTYAGIELRLACNQIMEKQGYPEPTGMAKITPAFNLPSKYVIHTVGPIVNGKLTKADIAKLASSYRSCLKIAAENGLGSIAFCCISTGVFGFPQDRAAEIAVQTVEEFLDENPRGSLQDVVFNVFKESDLKIYQNLLG